MEGTKARFLSSVTKDNDFRAVKAQRGSRLSATLVPLLSHNRAWFDILARPLGGNAPLARRLFLIALQMSPSVSVTESAIGHIFSAGWHRSTHLHVVHAVRTFFRLLGVPGMALTRGLGSNIAIGFSGKNATHRLTRMTSSVRTQRIHSWSMSSLDKYICAVLHRPALNFSLY